MSEVPYRITKSAHHASNHNGEMGGVMSKIVLDQAAAEQLASCGDVTVLYDPQGAVIGVFEPTRKIVYEPGVIPEFDEAELDRREERWQGVPSEEVRQRLEQWR